MASRKRVKNIKFDDEDYADYDGYDDYDDYSYSKPKPKPKAKAAAAPKAQAKSKPAPNKATTATSSSDQSSSSSSKQTDTVTTTSQGLANAFNKAAATTTAPLLSTTRPSLAPTSQSPSAAASSSPTPLSERSQSIEDYDDGGRVPLNLVVVGHVDAGKSTLMGHLLVKMEAVTSRQLHKFRNESKQVGKGSFVYAWVLDEGEDERRRGVTIDIAVKYFKTKTKNVTVLDAPGHRDFVPNMLLGAVQADAAILVVDARNFDAGFERGGQTKEHVQLVRAVGISRLLVVINKLDLYDWDESKFEYIKNQLHTFITGPDVRYKSHAVQYIPVSAFEGVNLVDGSDPCPALQAWWNGPSLVGAIDRFELDTVSQPSSPTGTPRGQSSSSSSSGSNELKACISDVWSSGSTVTCSVKIESGGMMVGDTINVLPSNENAVIKSLDCRGRSVRKCFKGDYVESVVMQLDPIHVRIGSVLTNSSKQRGQLTPVPSTLTTTNTISVRLVVFDIDIPLCQGQQVMSYVHTSVQPACIQKLIGLISKTTGQRETKKPRALARGDMAIVQLTFSHNIVVDYFGNSGTALCRVILRDRGKTIAAGMVVDPATL